MFEGNEGFVNDFLLRNGPWQEFERNTARFLLMAGWKSPQIVGRSGDGGADVLAIHPKTGHIWIFQCKFSKNSGPGPEAINEARRAGVLYGADVICIVSSKDPSSSFKDEHTRLLAQKLPIYHLGPQDLLKWYQKLPTYAPGRYALRDYQAEALEKLRSSIIETKRGLLVLATGLGKTVVVAELLNDLITDGLLGDGRILVVAHTVPLINQLIMSFWKHLPKTMPTHRLAEGESPHYWEGVTFATIQSFRNVENPPYFDLIIIDEAHHLGAPEYIKAIEKLDPPKIAGITATPWRADGVSIAQWLGPPVFSMGIKEGLEQGYLSNVDYRFFIDNIDWQLVRSKSRLGYTIAQLNKLLLIPSRDAEAIRQIRHVFDKEDRRRGIVFSPSQVHAKSFASDLRMHGFSATSLTSDLGYIERYKRIAQFASGKLQFLCVVDIFNEGMDVPDVDLIVFIRVTHSRRIFIQQLGRGLRTSEDKDNVIVLDFAADIRRIHAALDLAPAQKAGEIERLPLSHAYVNFSDKSMGRFFYEWIADLGNIQDYEDDDIVRLPIIDPKMFNFPES